MKRSAVAFVVLSVVFWVTASQAEVYTVIKRIKTMNNGSDIWGLTLSRDGKNAAYINVNTKSVWKNGARVSGEGMQVSCAIDLAFIAINADGSKVAYFAYPKGEKKTYVWINDKRVSPELFCVGFGDFSSEGSRVGYSGSMNNRTSIWINDKKVSPEFEQGASPPVLGPDGKAAAYVAINSGKFSVWINERRISPWFDEISLSVSYDGTSCLYAARNGSKCSIWINDRKLSEFDHPSLHFGDNPVAFSRDRRNVAYIVHDKRASIWCNGNKVTPDFEGIYPLISFTPNGSEIAYSATMDYKTYSIWINDRRMSPEFDRISFAKDLFTETGKLIFAGYDNAKGEILIMQAN